MRRRASCTYRGQCRSRFRARACVRVTTSTRTRSSRSTQRRVVCSRASSRSRVTSTIGTSPTPPALITTKSGAHSSRRVQGWHVYNIDRSDVTGRTPKHQAEQTRGAQQGAVTTLRERRRAILDRTRNAVLSRCTGRRRVERACVSSCAWFALCQRHRLVHLDQDAAERRDIKGAPGAPWTGAELADGWLFGRHDPIKQWKGWVTAFDAESGKIRWKLQTPKPMVAAITATAGGAGVHR